MVNESIILICSILNHIIFRLIIYWLLFFLLLIIILICLRFVSWWNIRYLHIRRFNICLRFFILITLLIWLFFMHIWWRRWRDLFNISHWSIYMISLWIYLKGIVSSINIWGFLFNLTIIRRRLYLTFITFILIFIKTLVSLLVILFIIIMIGYFLNISSWWRRNIFLLLSSGNCLICLFSDWCLISRLFIKARLYWRWIFSATRRRRWIFFFSFN